MRAESAHAALLLMIIAGLGLAVFATLETYIPALQSACSVNPFLSCSKVDTSGHTTTFGIPDWSVGVGGFLFLLALDIPLYRTWRRDLLTGVVVVSFLGLVTSAYFAYVELAIIHALCPVCFSTYVADGLVFVLALWLFLAGRGSDRPARDSDDAPEKTESAPPAP
ncbi:MAG: vitamin K epoxide reductase family protein [Candidatus Lutacidiplasmatales archaeon]